MDMQVATACRWLPLHMRIALASSVLTAVIAVVLLIRDLVGRRDPREAGSSVWPHAVLLVIAACATISVLSYNAVTVRRDVLAYEASVGVVSEILRRAAVRQLAIDLVLPVGSAAVLALSLGLRRRRSARG